MQQLEQQPYMNSYANEFSPHTESSETRHVNHGQNWDAKLMVNSHCFNASLVGHKKDLIFEM